MPMGFQYFYKAKGMIFLYATVVDGYYLITIFGFFVEIDPWIFYFMRKENN